MARTGRLITRGALEAIGMAWDARTQNGSPNPTDLAGLRAEARSGLELGR